MRLTHGVERNDVRVQFRPGIREERYLRARKDIDRANAGERTRCEARSSPPLRINVEIREQGLNMLDPIDTESARTSRLATGR